MLRLDVTGRIETATGDVWPSSRLLVTGDGRAAVWSGTRGSNILVWSGRVADVEGTVGPWVVRGTDGTVLTATGGGCGCGTRLNLLGERDVPVDVPA